MSIFYVSGHSKIPKKTKPTFREMDEVPPGTYIIMKSACGEYSWVNDTKFIERYLTTPEDIRNLDDVVRRTDRLKVDGKRIYRPGDAGPIDQTISFRQGTGDRFFLGVRTAPIDVRQVQNIVFHLDRPFLENFYRNFHMVFKTSYNNGDTGFAEDPATFKDKKELVFNLMDMMSTYADSMDLMSYRQFEKLLTDERYFKNFLNHRVGVNTAAPKDMKISELVRVHGPGIYVIDTCRAYRKVTIEKDIVHVASSRKKGFGPLRVRQGGVQKALATIKPEARRAYYAERIANARATIPSLQMQENTRAEVI